MPADAGKDVEAADPARFVVIIAFDGVEAIDIGAPASVFSKAAQLHPGRYRLRIASPDGGTVVTNSGLRIADTCALNGLPDAIDTVIVAGGDERELRAVIADGRLQAWLNEVAPRARRIASVCTGAFVLAAAGLLDGRDATTHWRTCALLHELRPKVRVQRDRLYVRDGPVWTSAGVVTSIELALALVEQDLGHETAMEIARTLALPMLRDGEQPQLSPALQLQAGASHRLRDLVAWIGTHLQDELSVEALAERASMSPRQFARAFAAETGCTPARFVERSRVAAAAQLLRQTRWTQQKVASQSGFRSVDAMQRAFVRQHGLTPQAYRSRRQQPGAGRLANEGTAAAEWTSHTDRESR